MDYPKRKRSSSSMAAADQPPPEGVLSVQLPELLLECTICSNPLTVPVFQCVNGHILCSCCCKRVETCPSCSKKTGQIRCLAIESVLETIKVPCSNKIHGCTEEIFYSKKFSHEKNCAFVLTGCPFKYCNFFGLQTKLCYHLNTDHISSVIRMEFDKPQKFSMSMAEEFVVFREEANGVMFILTKLDRMSLGYIANDNFSKGKYVLVATGGEIKKRIYIKFQSLISRFGSKNDDFIQLPPYMFDSDGCLRLEIRILSKNAPLVDSAGGTAEANDTK